MGTEKGLDSELPIGQRSDQEILDKLKAEIAGQRRIIEALDEAAHELDVEYPARKPGTLSK